MEKNPSLISEILEGGKPPRIDVHVVICRRTIEELVVAAVLTATLIFFVKKHLF